MNKEVSSTLLVQVAFFVKHEVVGGQVEVLARTTFQIPDLVAACRWVNMSCRIKICPSWPIQYTSKRKLVVGNLRKSDDGDFLECRLHQRLEPEGVLHVNIKFEEEVIF